MGEQAGLRAVAVFVVFSLMVVSLGVRLPTASALKCGDDAG